MTGTGFDNARDLRSAFGLDRYERAIGTSRAWLLRSADPAIARQVWRRIEAAKPGEPVTNLLELIVQLDIDGRQNARRDVAESDRRRAVTITDRDLGHRNLEKGAWYLATFDEVFLGFGQDVPSTNTFDQNRFYIGIGRQEGSRIRWEVGYMNQVRTRYNKAPDFNNVDVNHILATWLFFDDLAKVF